MYSYYDMSSDWEWIAEARPTLHLNVHYGDCMLRQYWLHILDNTVQPRCGSHLCVHHDTSNILVRATHAKTHGRVTSVGRKAWFLLCADNDGTAVAPVAPACPPVPQATWMRKRGLARTKRTARRI